MHQTILTLTSPDNKLNSVGSWCSVTVKVFGQAGQRSQCSTQEDGVVEEEQTSAQTFQPCSLHVSSGSALQQKSQVTVARVPRAPQCDLYATSLTH